MGGSVSRILSLLWSKREIRILILGLVCSTVSNTGLFDLRLTGQRWENNASV